MQNEQHKKIIDCISDLLEYTDDIVKKCYKKISPNDYLLYTEQLLTAEKYALYPDRFMIPSCVKTIIINIMLDVFKDVIQSIEENGSDVDKKRLSVIHAIQEQGMIFIHIVNPQSPDA